MSVVRHVIVKGRVQGVGYRAWTEHMALRRELEGWVRNRRDGTVEAVFAGPEPEVAAAIEACLRGPPGSWVSAVDAEEGEAELLDRRRPGERFSMLPTA